MQRMSLVVGVALALVAVLLWLSWRAEAPPPLPVGPAPAPDAAPAAHGVIAPQPAAAAAPAERTEVAPEVRVGLGVRVLDPDRQPVAGATIEVRGDDAGLTFPPTGADGTTRSRRLPNATIHLKVHHAGRSGSGSWYWNAVVQEEVTIWIRPDHDVEVAVTGKDGTPRPGVAVALFPGTGDDSGQSTTTTKTDAGGIGHLCVEGDGWLAAHDTVHAVATVDGVRVPSGATKWSAVGPTRLSIEVSSAPTSGTADLVVHFVDQGGAPVDVDGELEWSRIQSGGFGSIQSPAGECRAVGRDATIRQLPLGDHLQLTLREADRLDTELEVHLAPGSTREEVQLRRGQPAPRLLIPLVTRDGAPVTTGDFVVTVLSTSDFYETERTLQPDAAGQLTFVRNGTGGGQIEIAELRSASRLHWPEPPRLQRPYRTTAGSPPPPNPPLAVLPFAPCAPGEVQRLAPVVVPDVAPRISGSVVDGEGRPVPDVLIWITTVAPPEPAPLANFATSTDAQGRFTILATALPDEVFVCGRRPLGFCTPVRTRPSAEPVTLVLQPTGAIAIGVHSPAHPGLPERLAQQLQVAVSVQIDDGALAGGTWAYFRNRIPVFEGTWRQRWVARARAPETGEFVFRDLVPGDYTVVCSVGEHPVVEVPAVHVPAGQTVRPPQLQEGAIAGGVDADLVRVLDRTGAPVANAIVLVTLPAAAQRAPGPLQVRTEANGEAWFVAPSGTAAEIEVRVPQCAPSRVHATAFPVDVTVGPGTSFDFVILGSAEAARGSRALTVVARQFTDTPPASPLLKLVGLTQFEHPQANLDEAGRATIPNLPPGTWRLWVGAVPPLQGGRDFTFVLLGDRTIGAGDPEHVTIEHHLTAAETATLLGR